MITHPISIQVFIMCIVRGLHSHDMEVLPEQHQTSIDLRAGGSRELSEASGAHII